MVDCSTSVDAVEGQLVVGIADWSHILFRKIL